MYEPLEDVEGARDLESGGLVVSTGASQHHSKHPQPSGLELAPRYWEAQVAGTNTLQVCAVLLSQQYF